MVQLLRTKSTPEPGGYSNETKTGTGHLAAGTEDTEDTEDTADMEDTVATATGTEDTAAMEDTEDMEATAVLENNR
jgi:hypothetical protein